MHWSRSLPVFETSGTQCVSVLFFCAICFIGILHLSLRLIDARKRLCQCRGIAYLPGASVESMDLEWLVDSHRTEIIQLLQKAPKPKIIESYLVRSHLDIARVHSLAVQQHTSTFDISTPPVSPTLLPPPLDVHIVGEPATCRAYAGVTSVAVESFAAAVQRSGMHANALAILQTGCTWSSGPSEADFTHTFSVPHVQVGDGTLPILLVVSNEPTQVEITLGYPRQIGAPLDRIDQILIETNRREYVAIKGIFAGMGDGPDECFVCYDQKPNTVILPCRHCCICTRCITQLREHKCVVCRQRFNKYLFTQPEQQNVPNSQVV